MHPPVTLPGTRSEPREPLALVAEWYEAAVAAGLPEPHAMALATASAAGRPSVRIVLLKGLDERGATFFTNYGSRKGRELAENPRAAATLYWQPLHRAVRLEGPVELLGAEESDAYFASRPRGARLGAWASRQGAVLTDDLAARVRELGERFGDDIPRPEWWGGYRLAPDAVELWEGRPDRLHHRVHYVRDGDAWRSERLSP